MKRPQWITVGIAILLVAGLYAATSKKLFGPPVTKSHVTAASPVSSFSIDSMVAHAKTHLTPEQATRLNFLEHTITRGDVKEQKIHIYHQLARFWKDSMSIIEPNEWFAPYAWYTAEAARLENSEKSLTFAAHLLLNNLVVEAKTELKQWEASQATDLFRRSLDINPDNDSSKVGLGAVIMFGGVGAPMEGIEMIRNVTEKDSNNVYAHWTLGQASLMSGQMQKAVERFKKVSSLQPKNLEAILLVADISEKMGNKADAIVWYGKLLPLIDNPAMKKEVEARIAKLKN
jgi:tetratricopeptide (TPR) repeat protein